MFMYLLSGMDAKFHPTPNACLSGCSCLSTQPHSPGLPCLLFASARDQKLEVWKAGKCTTFWATFILICYFENKGGV